MHTSTNSSLILQLYTVLKITLGENGQMWLIS